MRRTVKTRICSGVLVTIALGVSACEKHPEDSRLDFKNAETVTITANCGAGNQIDVVVDKWVLRMKKKGDVTFNTQTTTGAVVELAQKAPASWPFDEASPLRGNARGKIKDKNGDYRYNIRIVCGLAPNQQTVVIDPDIIVN